MALNRPADQKENSIGLFDSGLGVLFLASIPMILLLFQGTATTAFTAILQLTLFLAALRLIHCGQQIQNSYDSARNARAPRLPRKILGALLIGLMVMILAGHHFYSLLLPFGFGVLAAALSIAAFGIDPLKDKGEAAEEPPAPASLLRPDDASDLEKVDIALGHLVHDIAELGDDELARHVESQRNALMALIRALCTEPADVKRLRKPVSRLLELLEQENSRLVLAWQGDDHDLARKRYLMRVRALAEAFEKRARKSGSAKGRDAFELQADLLLNRMRQDRAA